MNGKRKAKIEKIFENPHKKPGTGIGYREVMGMENAENTVWQRVFGGPDNPPSQELGQLIRETSGLAQRYGQLMGTYSGKQRELLRQLREGETANLACLRGILCLAGTPVPVPVPLPGSREPAARTLERCWYQTRRCLVEYTARSAEPEFGPVFRSLADREAEHCVLLARLLGSIR